MIRRDRTTSKGGGVLILTSDKYMSSEPSELNKHNDTEMVWIQLQITGSKKLYICALYRPPSNSDTAYLDGLNEALTHIAETSPSAHIWVAGDFNLPNIS